MSINNKNLINKVCENIRNLKKEDLDKAMKKVDEEKIIDKVMMIDQWKVSGDNYTQDELNAIGEFIDLYKEKTEQLETALNSLDKEKEKNEELKILIEQNLKYSHNLEKDLFENCSNYVVSKDKIRERIRELKIIRDENADEIKRNMRFYSIYDSYNLQINELHDLLLEEE